MCDKNFATIGDINLAYNISGKGFPLVLIMGYTGTMDIWPDKMLDKLSSKNKIITFDNRGMGKSDSSENEYSIELYTNDLFNLLDNIKIDKVNILGYSMGVSVALEAALLNPARINNLILYAGSCGGDEEIQPAPEVMHALEDILEVSMTDSKKFFSMFFSEEWLNNNNPRNYMPIPETIPTEENVIKQFNALINWKGVYNKLTNIKQPTLVLVGKDDVIRPPENSLILAKNISDSCLVQMNGGHGLMWQYPEKVANIIINFLNNND
ncbi:MAG: alpha/beta hydrolase [Cyanobacteriota bacterium]